MGQLGIFADHLSIDRLKFFIDRLHLLLGGFQFLVGRLQFLVDRLIFLIRGFHFLVGDFQLVDRGLELRSGRQQFLGEILHCAGRRLARSPGLALRYRETPVLKRQNNEVAVIPHRFRDQRQQLRPAIDAERNIGVADRHIVGLHVLQRRSHGGPQRFAQNIEEGEARRAGRRFQILAHRSAGESDDLVAAINHHVRRIVSLHHQPRGLVDLIAGPCRARFGRRGYFGCRAARREVRKCCLWRLATLKNAMLLAVGREQFRCARHRFRGPQKQPPTRLQGVVKAPHNPVLQGGIDVDQQVAARNQIELGKRWVLDDAVR